MECRVISKESVKPVSYLCRRMDSDKYASFVDGYKNHRCDQGAVSQIPETTRS